MQDMDNAIVKKLLDGWTLKTLMEPDPGISTNGLAHLENLTLKFVIIRNAIFWGYTLHHHLNISSTDFFLSEGTAGIVSFLYSNFGGKRFLSTIGENLNTHEYYQILLPLSRYRYHHWVLIDDYEEIFSLTADSPKDRVEHAIRNNDDLKCSFLDQDGYWRIINIHIPYFVYETGKIYLQSEPAKIQPAFLSPDFTDVMTNRGEELAASIAGGRFSVNGPLEHAQYVIDLDGNYTTMESQLKKEWLSARDIRVFKRKLPDNTARVIY